MSLKKMMAKSGLKSEVLGLREMFTEAQVAVEEVESINEEKRQGYEWVLQGKYPGNYGWEDLTAEETKTEIKKRLQEYKDNEGGTYRIIMKKEDTEEEVAEGLASMLSKEGVATSNQEAEGQSEEELKKLDHMQSEVRLLMRKGDTESFKRAKEIQKEVATMMEKIYQIKNVFKTNKVL